MAKESLKMSHGGPPRGYSIFSAYVGSDPASTVHPKKYQEFQATQKIIPILYLDHKKTLNCIEMALKLVQFCDDPPKISTKSSYPQKIFIFLNTPKNIEIQNFEPPKIARAYVCVKISECPPGGGPRAKQASGTDQQIKAL